MKDMQVPKGDGRIARVLSLTLAACLLLFLTGCRGPLAPYNAVEAETGTVSLTIDAQSVGRAIMPGGQAMTDFDAFRVVFSHATFDDVVRELTPAEANVGLDETLIAGSWTLTVTAYYDGDTMARFVMPFTLASGDEEVLSAVLRPIREDYDDGATGIFEWDLTFPDNTTVTRYVRSIVAGAIGSVIDAHTDTNTGASWTGTLPLPVADYFVVFALEHPEFGELEFGRDLHIFWNLTSFFEFTFSYTYFIVEGCGECAECVFPRLPGEPGDLDAVRAGAVADGPGSIVWNMQAHTAEALLPRFATTPSVTNRGTVFTYTVDGQVIAFVSNFSGAGANDPNGGNWAPIVILPIDAAGVEAGDILRVEGRFGMPTHPWQGGDGRLRRGFGSGHEVAQALTIAPGPFTITYTITQPDIDRGLTIGFNSFSDFGPAMIAGTNHFIIGIDDMVILRGDPQDCAECDQYPCICCTHCNTFPCECVGIAFNMADGAFQELAPGAFTQGNTPAGGFNIGDGNTTMTVIAYEGRNFLRLSGMSVNHNGLNLPTEGVRAGDTIRIMGRIGAVGADVRLLIDWSLWPPRDPASPTILTPGTEFTITHTIPWGAATFGDLRLTANNAAGDFYIYSVIIGRGLADPSLAAEIEAAENWRPSAEPCDCPTCTNCDCRGDDASCEVGCTCTPPDQDWARVLAALEYTGHDGTNEQSVTVNATDDGIVITTTSRWHGLRMFLSHLQGYILDTTPPTGDNFRVMRFTIEYNTAHGAVTEADVSATTDRPESGVVTFITNANNAAVRFLQNPGADRDPAGSTFTITKMEIATVAGWRDDDTIASLTCIFDVLP